MHSPKWCHEKRVAAQRSGHLPRDQVTSVPMVFVGRRGTLAHPARLTSRVASRDREEEEDEGFAHLLPHGSVCLCLLTERGPEKKH